MTTFADPARRTITQGTLDFLAKHNDPKPNCRVCGKALKPGDYIDPYHPIDHTGNLCSGTCAANAPQRRG